MNNDNFLIENSDLDLARNICSEIEISETRNRAVANVLAGDIAKKYFTELEVDTESGLHRIGFVLNNTDIADVYIRDCYIDVRLYFDANELCVPKSHFDMDVLPVAYMFIKVDAELSGGLVTGFVTPNSIDTSKEYNGYYRVCETDLLSFYDIEPLLNAESLEEEPENFESLIFDYLDGRIEDISSFYNILIKSRYYRIALKKASNVQNIFKYVTLVSPKEEETVEETLDISLEDTGLNSTENFEDLEMDSGLALDLTEDDSVDALQEVDSLDSLEESVGELELSHIEEEDIVSDFNLEDSESLDIIQESDIACIEENPLEETFIGEDLVNPSEELEAVDSTQTDFELTENIESTQEELQDMDSEENDTLEIINEYEEDLNSEQILYNTNVTPSIDSIEDSISEDDLERMLENDETSFKNEQIEISEENVTEKETELLSEESIIESQENISQIEDLFGEESDNSEIIEETFVQTTPQKGNKILPILGALVIIVALGYFGYTKFASNDSQQDETIEPIQTVFKPDSNNSTSKAEPMPIETVENIKTPQPTNEGNAISIPAIEQNLDASILVSNLSINWEVPASYVTNSTAKRYFTKLGKIIQLNLKTELLLLSKPPITNKIMVELEYNKKNNKFDVKEITASSGEKIVDDIVTQTVKNALAMNLKINMNSFAGTSGNPVLIIRL